MKIAKIIIAIAVAAIISGISLMHEGASGFATGTCFGIAAVACFAGAILYIIKIKRKK